MPRQKMRRIPWWSRLYLTVPRRAIFWSARLYASAVLAIDKAARRTRMPAVFGAGPARRDIRRLQPYADLVGRPVAELEGPRLAELIINGWDMFFVYEAAFPRTPPVRFERAAHFTDTLAEGRGVIVGMEHTLHRRLMPAAIQSLAGRTRFIAAPSRRKRPASRLSKRILQSYGRRLDRDEARSTRRVREAFRLLASGQAIVITTDGRGGKLLPLTFLGKTVYRPTGPARIAYRTGAPIVMAFPRMEADGSLTVEFFPPLRPRTDLPEDDAIIDLMTRVAEIVEPWVRARPWAQGLRFVRQVYEQAMGTATVEIGMRDGDDSDGE